ncbi:MAG: hypothetical protein ABI702_08680 [Burkholderiales bacterium]
MSGQGFGVEKPAAHVHGPHEAAARYLVLIESGGSGVARLFLDTRALVAEFDASAAEVSLMTQGLLPTRGAQGAEWDHALAGHSQAERAAAEVFTLDV